jgi:hypothetical protein
VADAEDGRRHGVVGRSGVTGGRRGVLERSRRTGPGSAGRESGEPPRGGPIDPATGLREWYDPHPQGHAEDGYTWAQILDHWHLIEADLHQLYGIDVESGILRARSWRWLRTRITGLLAADSRLAHALTPPDHRIPRH